MIPIRAPVTARYTSVPKGSLSLPPFLFSRIKSRMIRPPIIPRVKASRAEEMGIYLLKMPMVPKISMDVMTITTDFGSFTLLFIHLYLSPENPPRRQDPSVRLRYHVSASISISSTELERYLNVPSPKGCTTTVFLKARSVLRSGQTPSTKSVIVPSAFSV